MIPENSTALKICANILQQHEDWLSSHIDELITQYLGKIVAILYGPIVGIGETYQEVYQPFLASGSEWMPIVMRIPHADDLQEVLL
ncbi:MAG: hypothetical protein N5P05_004244 (plasmid) [Chroococcopsis gigantea SAG 12.99]|jgi:hypothetical protein|nr:hypothetical protein [Chroococcopsis gigantea SAG 12.99]